jgi:hypothetical protein
MSYSYSGIESEIRPSENHDIKLKADIKPSSLLNLPHCRIPTEETYNACNNDSIKRFLRIQHEINDFPPTPDELDIIRFASDFALQVYVGHINPLNINDDFHILSAPPLNNDLYGLLGIDVPDSFDFHGILEWLPATFFTSIIRRIMRHTEG